MGLHSAHSFRKKVNTSDQVITVGIDWYGFQSNIFNTLSFVGCYCSVSSVQSRFSLVVVQYSYRNSQKYKWNCNQRGFGRLIDLEGSSKFGGKLMHYNTCTMQCALHEIVVHFGYRWIELILSFVSSADSS